MKRPVSVLISGAPGVGKSTVLGEVGYFIGGEGCCIDNEATLTLPMKYAMGCNLRLENDHPQLMSLISRPGQLLLQTLVRASAFRYEDEARVPQSVFWTSPSENLFSMLTVNGAEITLLRKLMLDFEAEEIDLLIRPLVLLPHGVDLETALTWDLESKDCPASEIASVEEIIQGRLLNRMNNSAAQEWIDRPKRGNPQYYWGRLRLILKTVSLHPDLLGSTLQPILVYPGDSAAEVAQMVLDSLPSGES